MHLTIGGRAVTRVEIIDGQALDDSEMKRYYDLLVFTMGQQFDMKDESLGAFTGTFIPPESPPPAPLPSELAPSVSPAAEAAPSVSPAAEAAPPPPATTPTPSADSSSVTTVESATPASSTSTPSIETVESSPAPSKDMSVVRVGVLISSILEYFSSVFCAVKQGEDSALYSIEDSDGILCEVEVKGGSIRFLQRYDFRGKRNDVLSLLQARLASVGL